MINMFLRILFIDGASDVTPSLQFYVQNLTNYFERKIYCTTTSMPDLKTKQNIVVRLVDPWNL